MKTNTENLKFTFQSENDDQDLNTIKATNLCTLKQYKSVYPRFRKEFLDEYEDNTEELFIENEINNALIYIKMYKRAIEKYLNERDNTTYNEENRKTIKNNISRHENWIASQKSIMGFLNERKKELSVDVEEEIDIKKKKGYLKFTGKAKLIGLNELGVIDLIKNICPANTPVSNIAEAIAPLIGERPTTMQSYFNQLLSEEAEAEHNHPYRNEKTVQEVKDFLKSKKMKLKTN